MRNAEQTIRNGKKNSLETIGVQEYVEALTVNSRRET